MRTLLGTHPGFEAPEIKAICGIPLRWFRQVEAACDVFLSNRNIQMPTFREKIRLDAEAGIARTEAFRRLRAANFTAGGRAVGLGKPGARIEGIRGKQVVAVKRSGLSRFRKSSA